MEICAAEYGKYEDSRDDSNVYPTVFCVRYMSNNEDYNNYSSHYEINISSIENVDTATRLVNMDNLSPAEPPPNINSIQGIDNDERE